MVNLTINELRLNTEKRGIKNYKNMSRENKLSTLDELENSFKNYHKMDMSEFQKCKIFHKMN